MNLYDDLAQVANAEKYGKKLIMCIECVNYRNGLCKRTGYKVRQTENCIFGKENINS